MIKHKTVFTDLTNVPWDASKCDCKLMTTKANPNDSNKFQLICWVYGAPVISQIWIADISTKEGENVEAVWRLLDSRLATINDVKESK